MSKKQKDQQENHARNTDPVRLRLQRIATNGPVEKRKSSTNHVGIDPLVMSVMLRMVIELRICREGRWRKFVVLKSVQKKSSSTVQVVLGNRS